MSTVHDAAPPRRRRFPLAIKRWPRCLQCSAFLAYCGFLFFYGLDASQLHRTESLRAIIAQEFLRSGNWIVPTLYGEPLLTKPPGMYTAIALVSWPFGRVTEWSARLPSALAATATVALFSLYFRRQLGARAGWIAALLLPMSLMWLDKATAAEIDMLQVFWVTAAIICFLRALENAEQRAGQMATCASDSWSIGSLFQEWKQGGRLGSKDVRCVVASFTPFEDSGRATPSPGAEDWFWWFAALLCVAGGVLTKWTAPAFFYGTVIPLLWLRGRLRLLWCRQHVVGALVGLSVCLAWVLAVIVQVGWDALYLTVSREALMRLSPSHHHRPYPWDETLTHPLRIFIGALPVSVYAMLTLRRGFTQGWTAGERRLLIALHCWVWPSLLFWSLTPEHSVRHSFPLYPGIAGLAVMYWTKRLARRPRPPSARSRARLARGFAALLTAWLIVKLVFVVAVVPARTRNRHPREKGEQIAALVPPSETLYLSMLKDEGIMFYYGRTVRRIADLAQLTSSAGATYCILDEAEWTSWEHRPGVDLLLRLSDGQGAPIALVRAGGPHLQKVD